MLMIYKTMNERSIICIQYFVFVVNMEFISLVKQTFYVLKA